MLRGKRLVEVTGYILGQRVQVNSLRDHLRNIKERLFLFSNQHQRLATRPANSPCNKTYGSFQWDWRFVMLITYAYYYTHYSPLLYIRGPYALVFRFVIISNGR